MGSKDMRPDIRLRARLDVRVPKLEDDLRIPDRKAILIRYTPPQNKSVVVEAEVGCIDEEDFTDLERLLLKTLRREFYAALLSRLLYDVAEREETFARVEVIRLQHHLAGQI